MTGPNRLNRGKRSTTSWRRGVTLLELTTVVILLAIISWIAFPRIVGNSLDAKKNTCYMNVRDVEVQAELWYRNQGTWPAADLSEMGADSGYFPDGLPSCPVDGTTYTFDGVSQRIAGHSHP